MSSRGPCKLNGRGMKNQKFSTDKSFYFENNTKHRPQHKVYKGQRRIRILTSVIFNDFKRSITHILRTRYYEGRIQKYRLGGVKG